MARRLHSSARNGPTLFRDMTMESVTNNPPQIARDVGVAQAPQALRWRLWQRLQQCAAASLLVMVSPLLAVIYALVKADSPGPFLYSQQRPGYRGRIFTAFKVRTMTVGADRDPMLARAVTSQSPEVTRIGRLLRDLKLDELPQLLNAQNGGSIY